jgi:hypothetical protein
MRRLVLPSILLLSACAGTPGWSNPNLPKERAGADYAACRRASEAELGMGNYEPPGDERTGDPVRLAEREHLRKRFTAMVGACMRAKGYFPQG